MSQGSVNIVRLELVKPGPDGRPVVFLVGAPWPTEVAVSDHEGRAQLVATPAVVGGIFFLPTETKTESESYVEEEDEVDDDGVTKKTPDGKVKKLIVTVTESKQTQTPAHYEVWAYPDDKSVLRASGETRCLRLQPAQVLFAEETWPMSAASEVVKMRAMATVLPDEDDDEPVRSNGQTASPS
jgi:hypothetical protein